MSDEIDGQDLNPILDAIDAAEEILDPLDGLVEKSAEDPGAAFTPEVLERLVALKAEDRAAFEALRAKLKKAGCRVTALDEAIVEESGDGGRGPTQADILIDLAGAAELFHAADGTAFADLDINGCRQTWPVRTKQFKRWLARQFYEATGGAPSSEALQSALNVVEAKAHFDAPELPVFIRVGGIDGKLYLDLGDEAWRAIEIATTGWRVIENRRCGFAAPPECSRCQSRCRAGRSSPCALSSTCSPIPTSYSSSPGRWLCCAIVVPIR